MIKKFIRRFSLWLNDKTRRWVVPSKVWQQLDAGDALAGIDIADAAVRWGILDPEIVRASLVLRRVRFMEEQKAKMLSASYPERAYCLGCRQEMTTEGGQLCPDCRKAIGK